MNSYTVGIKTTRSMRAGALCAVVFACLAARCVCGQDEGDSSISTAPPSPATSPSDPGGRWNFQTDLFTGRFTTRVPIVLPPGRGKSTPTVQLVYNSGQGNGWCGVGWALDMGYIQRETKDGVPVGHDTNGDPITNFLDGCSFVVSFSGVQARLISIDGTNYVPDVQRNFIQFNYDSHNDNWKAIDKGGTEYYFGSKTDLSSQLTNRFGTFRWALDRIVDINGNAAYFSYSRDAGQIYLSEIGYNAHETGGSTDSGLTNFFVDFYTSARPDTNINCSTGERIDMRQRLSNIVVRVNSTIVRQYNLTYQTSPSTLRSLLTQVQEAGSNGSNLPPVSFGYQRLGFKFNDPIDWGPVLRPTKTPNNARYTSLSGDKPPPTALTFLPHAYFNAQYEVAESFVGLFDINGDGLPDRVVTLAKPPLNHFSVQLNNGSGFGPLIDWPLSPPGQSTWYYNTLGSCVTTQLVQTLDNETNVWGLISVTDVNPTNSSYAAVPGGMADMMDINGDGLPDRVMRPPLVFTNCTDHVPFTSLIVQLNSGQDLGVPMTWGPTTNRLGDQGSWNSLSYADPTGAGMNVELMDMNGDRKPDRVMWTGATNATTYVVQLNIGNGFSSQLLNWGPLDNSNSLIPTSATHVEENDSSNSAFRTTIRLQDINGDGLPDRIVVNNQSSTNGPWALAVQLNNGTGFESSMSWGPITANLGYKGKNDIGRTLSYTKNGQTIVELADINGDGLPDRITSFFGSKADAWLVQLNTGSGFGSPTNWGNVQPAKGRNATWYQIRASDLNQDVYEDLVDIDGDGLPDRVMRNGNGKDFVVQLNAGPFPDLMNTVSNGIGGVVQVSYTPSTRYDNTIPDGLPRLPFPVYTVSTNSVIDGFGNTNTTTYSHNGGYFAWDAPEFRGFNQVTVTDSRGAKTTTYFHQGRDSTRPDGQTTPVMTPDGQFTDDMPKKGFPYHIVQYGSDGKKYTEAINVVTNVLVTSGSISSSYFPYVGTAITYSHEGLTTNRAKAAQFVYDPTNGNLIQRSDLGAVDIDSNWNVSPLVAGNQIYTFLQYTNFTGASYSNVIDHISSMKVCSDSDGSTQVRLTTFGYDSSTRLTSVNKWISGSMYASQSLGNYDVYGNPQSMTSAAGITSTITYDSAFHMLPAQQVTSNFVSKATFDVRCGGTLTLTDAKGLTVATFYDEFCRPVETVTFTNNTDFTNPANGVWRSQFDYLLSGISGGVSQNRVHQKVNSGNSSTSPETFTYFDGIGRKIQVRSKSEISGLDRVTTSVYINTGDLVIESLPYFDSGDGNNPMSSKAVLARNVYDPIGRMTEMVPPPSDTGSPTTNSFIYYFDGNDPWAVKTIDAKGRTRISYRDGLGRTTNIVEHSTTAGDVFIYYTYDNVGDLLQVKDKAGNITTMQYDGLGRKTSMTDPDMGIWAYYYDAASRMTNQVDAKGQKIAFNYNGDPLGRLMTKTLCNTNGVQVSAVTNFWDIATDGTSMVYSGQLFKVLDPQGYQKMSYDVRGRVLSNTRYLLVNSGTYATQNDSYDELDRVTQVTYPNNVTAMRYSYDLGGHLTQINSLSGTGSSETNLYAAFGFDELGRALTNEYGNGAQTTYRYYDNTKRLHRITTTVGSSNIQDLTYSYDEVNNIQGIGDNVYNTGSASAATTASYDDLDRLRTYVRGGATYNLGYDATGNITNGTEFGGGGTYVYNGVQPHAVTGVGGMTYAYDACGNMTNRNGQTLVYDEQNRLVQCSAGGTNILFGYGDSGERLWEDNTTTGELHIWIGGIYEIKNGKTLCHVFAGGQQVCTFEPRTWVCDYIGRHPILAGGERWLTAALDWPLQGGRAPLTATLIPLLGILSASVGSRWWERQACRRSYGRIGVSVWESWGIGSGQRRRQARLRLQAYPWWTQGLCALLIVATFLTVTPTKVEAITYDPVFYYYHGDQLGSSNILTDCSGNVVQHYEYHAFGGPQYQDNASAFPVSNRYTDQIMDEDTGLYYYGARYYDPGIGRFIQPDPTIPDPGDPQSYNRYSYVRNNPLKSVDPTGLDDVEGDDQSSMDEFDMTDFSMTEFGEGGGAEAGWDESNYWATLEAATAASIFAEAALYTSNISPPVDLDPFHSLSPSGTTVGGSGASMFSGIGNLAGSSGTSANSVASFMGTTPARAPTLADDDLSAFALVSDNFQPFQQAASVRQSKADAVQALILLGSVVIGPEDFLLEEASVETTAGNAVFWSGRQGANRAAAEAYAQATGKTTLEMTSAGQALEVQGAGIDAWRAASADFAKGASGDVTAFAGGSSLGSTWMTIEKPLLMQNPNISSIIIKDAVDTSKTTIIYKWQ